MNEFKQSWFCISVVLCVVAAFPVDSSLNDSRIKHFANKKIKKRSKTSLKIRNLKNVCFTSSMLLTPVFRLLTLWAYLPCSSLLYFFGIVHFYAAFWATFLGILRPASLVPICSLCSNLPILFQLPYPVPACQPCSRLVTLFQFAYLCSNILALFQLCSSLPTLFQLSCFAYLDFWFRDLLYWKRLPTRVLDTKSGGRPRLHLRNRR